MEVFLILSLGALSGCILAQFTSWFGLVCCGPVLAALSAAILQNHGFGWPSGIAIIVGCLSINQVGYLIGAHFRIDPTIHHASDAKTTLTKSTNGTKTTHLR
jgi:hypothetical protein